MLEQEKKTFEYKTWKLATEIDVHREPDSISIYKKIIDYLDRCQKELKGRYIDINNLEAIGSYVDWKSLFEETKKA